MTIIMTMINIGTTVSNGMAKPLFKNDASDIIGFAAEVSLTLMEWGE